MQSLSKGPKNEHPRRLALEQTPHPISKALVRVKMLRSVRNPATTSECWLQYVEGDQFSGFKHFLFGKIDVLPPADFGYVIRVQAYRRNSCCDATVTSNKVLFESAP